MHKHLTVGVVWFMAFWLSLGWYLLPFGPSQFIKPAHAAAFMMLLWDTGDGSPPAPWTHDATFDSTDGDPVLLRGNSTALGTGGANTHTHTITNATVDNANTGTGSKSNKGGTLATPQSHTHNITSSSMSTESSVPPFRGLQVIFYNNPTPPTLLPAHAIVMFDTTGAFNQAGFTRYSAQDTYYIQGRATTGSGTGVSALHGHTSVAFSTNGSTTNQDAYAGTGVTISINTHTHSLSGGTTDVDGDITPLTVNTVLAKVDSADTLIPTGMLAMFTATPDATWSVLSNGGGDYNLHYIRGAATYLAGQGSATHTHHKVAGYTTSTWTAATNVTTGTPNKTAATSHSHTLATPTFSDANNAPKYKDVIVAKRLHVDTISVTAPSDVTLATGVHPGENTPDKTFSAGTEDVTVIDDTTNAWSLTVISTNFTSAGSSTIAASNVKLKTNNNLAATPTTMTETDANVTETNYTTGQSINTAQEIVGGNTSANGTYHIQPTFYVVIPPDATVTDYTAQFTFTVACLTIPPPRAIA